MDAKLEKMKKMEKNGGNLENGVKIVENWENGGKFKKIKNGGKIGENKEIGGKSGENLKNGKIVEN